MILTCVSLKQLASLELCSEATLNRDLFVWNVFCAALQVKHHPFFLLLFKILLYLLRIIYLSWINILMFSRYATQFMVADDFPSKD